MIHNIVQGVHVSSEKQCYMAKRDTNFSTRISCLLLTFTICVTSENLTYHHISFFISTIWTQYYCTSLVHTKIILATAKQMQMFILALIQQRTQEQCPKYCDFICKWIRFKFAFVLVAVFYRQGVKNIRRITWKMNAWDLYWASHHRRPLTCFYSPKF